MRTSIRRLEALVASRVAAGEVIERPASAVKELLENALDAAATRISVFLEEGGRRSLVVEDDGLGIPREELPLAVERYATSKLATVDDLEHIATLGYRGEALASLAAVARLEIRSRERGRSGEGGILRVAEGKILFEGEVSCPEGTRVQVEDLFFNLPARRKFLKSAAGEVRRVATVLREYALAYPGVSFLLFSDGRRLFASSGEGRRDLLLGQIWGPAPPLRMRRLRVDSSAVELWFQPLPGASRAEVISFVNGRRFADGAVRAALTQGGSGGNWLVLLSVPPEEVDVNIHPAKTEVRFRNAGQVFRLLRSAAEGLRLAPEVPLGGEAAWTPGADAERPFFEGSAAGVFRKGPRNEEGATHSPRRRYDDPDSGFGQGEGVRRSDREVPERFRAASPVAGHALFLPAASVPGVFPEREPRSEPEEPEGLRAEPSEAAKSGARSPAETGRFFLLGRMRAGYVLVEDQEGLLLVDPHAAQERVHYEKIRRLARGGTRRQPLALPPALPPSLALRAEERREALEELGFAFLHDEGMLLLAEVPFCLGDEGVPPVPLLRGTLEALDAAEGDGGAGDPRSPLWRVWATMACKRSVKLGDALDERELFALLDALFACEEPETCPHGRPTLLRLSRSALERFFGRA
ncbi:DNA mismatch repair endonuclease MutL [Aminiphilus sp.]|uniref:DNA mismatch repair endonuclease MutL n=1 Tax=Aminiphilus sp. TaxID=1872488 RepID=UPI00262C8089|nr:DNA mismatch repair endonuclease MutL [Aminiphilus sp.]